MFSRAILFLALFSGVFAQQGVWEQCGGEGWTGATICVSGAACTVQNDWYSQCLPSTSAPATTVTVGTTPASSPVHTTTTVSGPAPTQEVNYWFSFGDSYTQTDFDPTSTLPTVGNPLGNPPYPGYTAVGGTNWIDVDTVMFNKSLILTYNYAYGGATIDSNLVAPYEPTVISMVEQIQTQFLTGAALKPATSPWTSENSLFSFWIGINDIGNSYYESGNRSAFAETLLDAYFAQVQDIVRYNVGGRNFLFINVPPIDRSPLMVSQGAAAQASEASVIADFNTRLASRVTQFGVNNTDVTTWLWDSNAAFTKVLNDPTTYGFIDNTSYGNTGDFWGNNYHSSSAAQTIWGQGVADLLADTVW
ncbi:hypothetical protein SCHPADRAFT_907541 [Schizopora paradoxa]|uniref:CBM1 domain-containing protein n=1 Tax=Schizopora paradoxa TaxID=27342 RepID=A0A0H2RD31_9AGAM|nr:hypothetical protein SCHPADRAFT_907541 [Schizopora paradoxa]